MLRVIRRACHLLDEDYLILSTIHSAKGQEWKSVFILNVVDGCMPSDLGNGTTAEIEEERRLLYVAVTRARVHLALSWAPARTPGAEASRQRSRFLASLRGGDPPAPPGTGGLRPPVAPPQGVPQRPRHPRGAVAEVKSEDRSS